MHEKTAKLARFDAKFQELHHVPVLIQTLSVH